MSKPPDRALASLLGEAGSAERPAVEPQRPNAGADAAGRTAESPPMVWRLWFPARLGPPRKRTHFVAGVKLSVSGRVFELPPTQNDRLHHMVKARWVKEWREAGKAHALAHGIPSLQRVRITTTVFRHVLGKADASNDLERVKPLVDGLVDAGVIADDRRRYVEYGPCTEERAGNDGFGILLTVEALAPAATGAGEGA